MNAKHTWFLIFLMSFCFSTAWANSPPSGNIIVFGDSLSDIGNNNWIHAVGAPITSLDKQGQKLLWVNYLAKILFNNPAYSSNKNVSPLNDNVSYAYASADTSNDYLNADWPQETPIPQVNNACLQPGLLKNNQGNVTSACVPGLLKQIDVYLKDINGKPNPSTTFFIWAGANDLFYKLPTGESPKKILVTAINNINTAKNKLIDRGVLPQQIYVINMPDLSKTPYAIKNSLQQELAAISVGFNMMLMSVLTQNNDTYPGIPSSHIISIYDLLNDIVENPEKFGLKNVTQSCIENMQEPLCDGYLFLDLKHATATMNNAISEYIKNKIT